MIRKLFCVVAIVLAGTVCAQTTEPFAPVPLLTPEQEAATFSLPAGFKAQVVAAEPMVAHPVAIAFDTDGRLWVAEMRGYMPNPEGTGELKPVGCISMLEDTDGDGRMDKKTIFLDKLALPRAIGFAGDGVLVGVPPTLLFCHDRDGDGKCDEQRVLLNDYGIPQNPENCANGLLYGLDNWIYSADYGQRLRWRKGEFEFSPIPVLGQFGLTRDDLCHWFFNTNSDYLRGSLIPPHYSSRNANTPAALANMRIGEDQKVYPGHASTVNRGYRPGFLRDGKLDAFTAACGPCIYRDNLLGPEFYGNAFICEPSANLVRRSILTETGVKLSAKNAYSDREFIASTYERFRPVNMTTGPEGALYIVDMHHGLLQHKMSLTDWAKKQYLEKELEKHLMTGRIFRIVPENYVPKKTPKLSHSTSAELVAHLKETNGWVRDTAQRLLVDQNDPSAESALREMASSGESPMHRIDALWTLEGMNRLDRELVRNALADRDAHVRAQAVRLAEPMLKDLLPNVVKLSDDPEEVVRVQVALSVSGFSDDVTADLLRKQGENASIRQAIITGVANKEIPLLKKVMNDCTPEILADLARSVAHRDLGTEMVSLLDLAADDAKEPAKQLAILSALPTILKDEYEFTKLIDLPTRPASLDALESSKDIAVHDRAQKVAAIFNWPGKPIPPRPKAPALTANQKKLYAVGNEYFVKICAQCHGKDGMGMEGKAPPMVNSPWILGPETRLVRIVLHGLHGPIHLHGKLYNMDMPALGALTDDQIAGVLTFIRRQWGHDATAIEPATVQNIRDWTQAHKTEAWTEQELLKIK